MPNDKITLSVVVPVFNEQAVLTRFHKELAGVLAKLRTTYEILYCNDGSTDGTLAALKDIASRDKTVRVLSLSRNFGKELATTAGIKSAAGQAVLVLDADGQHPVKYIPKFFERWQAGSQVVVGVRKSDEHEGWVKHVGSKLFYKFFNAISRSQLAAGTTDFCLVDRVVVRDFAQLQERNRMTRGLIDWLGYDHDYIYFKANKRIAGKPTYTKGKLLKLAVDGVVSLSVTPLYLTAYVGAIVMPLATLVGLGMVVNAAFGDPLNFHATGTAYVVVLLLFLIGAVLLSQGIIGLYVSHIHAESQGRPLYIIDESKSIRL